MHIDGPAGSLEARHDPAPEPGGGQAVLCHPHPRYGGSMADGVLDCLAKRLLAAGVGVLRFNFRGVGASASGFDGGRGEVQDLLAAAAWLRDCFPGEPLWAGGYSFGAWVTWEALERGLMADRVVLVSPPVGPMAFASGPGGTPVDVVAGSDDDFIDPQALDAWSGVTVHTIAGADHFYSGHRSELEQALREIASS